MNEHHVRGPAAFLIHTAFYLELSCFELSIYRRRSLLGRAARVGAYRAPADSFFGTSDIRILVQNDSFFGILNIRILV